MDMKKEENPKIINKVVHFKLAPRTGFTEIIPPPRFTVIYLEKERSEVIAKQNFGIDDLGNYFPWNALQFNGYMGQTGISSTLPLDYRPEKNE